MKPREKGWLENYIEFRKDLVKDVTSEENRKTSHPEQSLYRVLQPTGLMYGQSAGKINVPGTEHWTEREKMKILLAESLISSSLLFYNKPINNPEDTSKVIIKTLESIGNFYNNVFPEIATSTKTLFGRKKSALELAEKILEKRIEYTSEFDGNFWVYFFHNSLLFLDVFIFGQWIHTNADRIVADFFRYEREELRFSLVKVIAAASHANSDVAYEEQKFFEYFLQSTDLSLDKRREGFRIFQDGIAIEDINLPSENSWILKKFFLEVGILTLWADKRVEQTEVEFLKKFCQYLRFSDDDLENSLIAIEGFILEHWEQLTFLQNKKDYNEVSEQFIKRVANLVDKNKSKLLRKLQENGEVINLLRKARSNELSDEEKEDMREALIQMLKTIPSFAIISLPLKFLTLPVLLKILPKNFFSDGMAE